MPFDPHPQCDHSCCKPNSVSEDLKTIAHVCGIGFVLSVIVIYLVKWIVL